LAERSDMYVPEEKVKVTLQHATKAQWESRCIALAIYNGVDGEPHALVVLPLRKFRYPLHSRLSGPQGRSECVLKV
jgi:hypothetical protein